MSNGGETLQGSSLHVQALVTELGWLEAVLKFRIDQHFQQRDGELSQMLSPPELPAGSELERLVREGSLGPGERLVLALALAPHLRPESLDILFVRNQHLDRGFTEFGGWKGQRHGGFLPTGETAAFLVAAKQLDRRMALLEYFEDTHIFARQGVLKLDSNGTGEPQLSGMLQISAEAFQRLSTGVWHKPDYNAQFPAKLTTTKLTWQDLVLAPEVMEEVETIHAWLQHGPTLMQDWGLGKAIKPGYRSLFYGPPGTGKTLTATLLGQAAKADVYRIDLSMVVSKYIGETEKNLARVFDQAQSRRWILFFDEADALFGKRTAAGNSNDRHANQEVAYLLQRVEDFPGVVILATNLRANLDEAFSRRFQSMIYFPMPDAAQRLRLWRSMLGSQDRFAADVNLEALAEAHEISGGAIANVLRFAAILALRRGGQRIGAADLRKGLAKELWKEGRTV